VSTLIDTLFAGVKSATVADNLLQQDYIRRPSGSAIETLGVLIVGILVSLLVAQFGLA
jgi:hypothetical protein